MDPRDVYSESLLTLGLAESPVNASKDSPCPSAAPSVPVYVSAIGWYGVPILAYGFAALILVVALYIDTVKHVAKNTPSVVKGHSAFVLGVYPVAALATVNAIVVPRAQLLAEALTQGMFMASMYQLFCLIVAYSGGEAELIRKIKPALCNPRIAPCCCWPCCFCLKPTEVDKKTVLKLRMLILQLPVVQGLIYMVLLVMWAERESLYSVNYIYFQPVVIFSIIVGIWGMTMAINLVDNTLPNHSLSSKFGVLKLVLVFSKFQFLLTRTGIWFNFLPCHPPFSPLLIANTLHNLLLLFEMVCLAVVARKLYKKPLPDDGEESNNNIEPVCVLGAPTAKEQPAILKINTKENVNLAFVSDGGSAI